MGAPSLVSADPCTTSSIDNISTMPLTFAGLRSDHGCSEKYSTTMIGNVLKWRMDMVFVVEHNVTVVHRYERSNGEANGALIDAPPSSRGIISPRMKKVLRLVNLVEVSLRFLDSYFGGSLNAKIGDILGTHEEILRAAFGVAGTFKFLLESLIYVFSGNDEAEIATKSSFDRTLRCENVILADTLPTPIILQKTFQKMVVSMSEADYNVQKVPELCPISDDDTIQQFGSSDSGGVGSSSEESIEGHDLLLCS